MIKPLPDAYNENEAFILVKPLADGDLAIGIFNFSDTQRELSLEFWDMGIPYAAGVSLSLHDCITRGRTGLNLPSDLHRLYHPMAVWLCARCIVEK